MEDGSSTAALTSRVNWLKDDQFLKRDFERLRVLKYNYNSDYLFGASTSTPQDKAETLLRELVKKRGASKACHVPLPQTCYNLMIDLIPGTNHFCRA